MPDDKVMRRYSTSIQWSGKDDAFLMALPEWKERVINAYVADGDTYKEGVKNGRGVIETIIEDALEHGEEPPVAQNC